MPPPPPRQRYNAKARGSVAGGSHKKRNRKTKHGAEGEEDNHQAQPHHEPGMSAKKKKRLDSYIAKKLQLERRDETLKTLAALQSSTNDSALHMLTTSSVGQNPLAPTSALQRAEKQEDKVVRRGLDKLKRRHGEIDSDSDSEDASNSKGKGKGRPVEVVMEVGAEEEEGVNTTVLESKAETKAREKALAKGRKGKLQMPRKGNWNPNTSKVEVKEDSSDFDSSDSDNYGSEEEQSSSPPSSESSTAAADGALQHSPAGSALKPPASGSALKHSAPTGSALKSSTAGSALKSSAGGAVQASFGSALKTSPGAALKPVAGSALKSSAVGGALKSDGNVGGALKRSDGTAFQPRVVVRGPKKFAPVRRRQDDSESSEDSEDSESEEGDDESSEASSDSEEDSEGDSEAGSGVETAEPSSPKRSKGFKNWALNAMGNVVQDKQPDLLAVNEAESSKPRNQSRHAPKTGEFVGPMGSTMAIPTSSLISGGDQGSSSRPTLKRRQSVTESRMELPILAEEQNIVEAILMNPVVVICGETGSGKTTQVPQMLYEAGFGFPGSANPGMIAVTQPRRVAAVSLAERVRDELGLDKKSGVVAHQIRYSSTTSPDTAIKFMTDGVLLRELATDFLLSRYSVIVVDEAHERGVNTDVLIGVLSRVAKLREKRWRETEGSKDRLGPLRIVIMSATLRVSDFAENPTLFSTPPPIIHIGARQHPVTMHFSRRTSSDYVTEAYKKVCKIHSRLPPGTILVFLTGQNEITGLCRKLDKRYGKGKEKGKGKAKTIDGVPDDAPHLPPDVMEAEDLDLGNNQDLAADVDDGIAEEDPEALDTDEDAPELDLEDTDMPMTVLPLYSLLSQEQQMAVFKPPPEGHRLVIVSTNVAETSLTIPGVRYVVDSGRAKERQFDAASGVQNFAVSWISKASAAQRAGRAGRTGPGHCYRLYSSALYEDHFAQFSDPEILRMPIEGVVLNMKAMNIDAVVNFPFPTPPDRSALKRAETLLQHLGALEKPLATRMINGVQQKGVAGGQITDLGKAMAAYPVTPRFAKMLAVGSENGCLPYIIAIVAGLSVGDPFMHESALEVKDEEGSDDERELELSHITSEELKEKERRKDLRSRFFKRTAAFDGKGESDMFKLLSAIGAYEHNPTAAFCSEYFLRHKAMQEIQQLRAQISQIAGVPLSPLQPPSDRDRKVMRQVLTAAFIDQIAVVESLALGKGVPAHSSTRGVAYRAASVPEAVYIHPSSVMFHHKAPEFIVFTELVRTSKVWVKGITKVNPAWLSVLAKDLCTFSQPDIPANRKTGGTEREVIVQPKFSYGGLSVNLPLAKKKQKLVKGKWVTLE